MTKHYIIVSIATILHLAILSNLKGDDDKLPQDSKALLSKLESFSLEVKQRADKEIKSKEAEVISILKTHLKRETEADQLDATLAALAIQVEIDRLERQSQTENQTSPEEEIKQLLLNGKWTAISNRAELEFKRDGTVFWGSTKSSWEIITDNEEPKLVLYFHGNRNDPNSIEFSEDRKQLTIVNRSGQRFTFE